MCYHDVRNDLLQSRVGVVTFSDDATLSLSFSETQPLNSTAFTTAVRNIPFTAGYTATWRAIELGMAHQVAFGSPLSAGIPKLAILVTDGQSETANVCCCINCPSTVVVMNYIRCYNIVVCSATSRVARMRLLRLLSLHNRLALSSSL